MNLDLSQYFDRIGYSGSLDPTIETMCALQRHQTLSVPFENLDVYLQYPVDQNIERIFNKIVLNKRGGWCYELNGLLGLSLIHI